MKRLDPFRLKLTLVSIFALGIGFLWYAHIDIRSKFQYDKLAVLARFVAKDYCSCRFVIGQTEAYCKSYVNAEVPLLGFRVRLGWATQVEALEVAGSTSPIYPGEPPYSVRVVSHAFLVAKGEARYYGETGCRLIP